MTTLIQVVGLTIVVIAALAMTRRGLRLPALLFVLLAMPGNVDNLLPQMTLDPSQIPNNTAPVASAIDALILLAVFLTFREQSRGGLGRVERYLVFAALGVWLLATASATWSLAMGVEPASVIRGSITFLRIPAMLFLAFSLRHEAGYANRLAFAAGLGILALVANGLYTSAEAEATRFTASTFGRNGFSVALIAAMLLVGGVGMSALMHSRRAIAAVALALASVALFAAIATGTRASLLALLPVGAVAIATNRTWLNRPGLLRMTAVALLAVVVSGSAWLFTPEGRRAISIITDPGETVDVITNPDDQPWYSPVTTRSHFWRLAGEMVEAHPVAGVGPFQWNIQRYALDPDAERIVVDTHNTYLQIAAEYGIPVLAAYLALLGSAVVLIISYGWRAGARTSWDWPATAIMAAAILIPATEMTNSHFFNIRIGPAEWLLLGAAVAVSYSSRLDGRATRHAAHEQPDMGAAAPR